MKLQMLVYRNFLRSSLIPLLVIELLLLVLYFGINLHISDRTSSTLVDEVKHSLSEITSKEALRINHLLEEVSRSARLMQRDHELFFKSERCFLPDGEPEFLTHENGVLYKANPVGASLYYSSSTEIGEKETRKAVCSESLDPVLASIVETNPAITQAYINTWDDMNRLYPFMADAPSQYGPVLEMEAFNFYYDADAQHNPGRGHVWTEVYLDPAGQGWMLSNLVPIYRGDFLEGVSGLDVTVESFIDNLLNQHYTWDTAALVIDSRGTILAMQEEAETLLGIKELKQHAYKNNITDTVTKPEHYQISNISVLPERAVQSLMTENASLEVQLNDMSFIVDSKLIPETKWRIITFVNTESFLKPISHLKSFSDQLGYLAVVIMVLFYMAFFVYLRWKSKSFASHIATPIEALTEATSKLGKHWSMESLAKTQVDEIQKLNRNFASLFTELKSRTEELVESSINIRVQAKEKELLAKLALTDSLTGIPNRLKLDKVLKETHRNARQDEIPYGVLLLDIDHFKLVNDNYGHQIGDDVLTQVSGVLSDNVRETDIVGRWGGEEFLVVCTGADNKSLLDLAERIRSAVANYSFSEIGLLTASIGVAVYEPEEDINHLLSRADQALYRAKKHGRNQVEY